MKKLFVAVVASCFFAFVSIAEDSPFNDNIPDTYTVVKGDTLWDISDHFLRDPWLWPEIWYVNPQIANPHLIYPGDVIKMIYLDGRPRLTLQRSRDVKLSPEVKVIAHGEAIEAIPLDVVNNFLSRNRVMSEEELEMAPYVVAGNQKRLLTGFGDDFYARANQSEFDVPVYGVYRKGDPYIDPETKELLGVNAQDIGTGKLKVVDGDIATLGATRVVEEIRIGDRLLPHEDRSIQSMFYPSAPEQEVNGVIISVEGGVSQVGPLDVVAINRGERDGLGIGNVLAIYKKGETIKDPIAKEQITLPNERAGLLMVFRAYEKMSFGLVLETDRPLSIGDIVQNP